MDFFKSVFSEDPDPPRPESASASEIENQADPDPNPPPNPNSPIAGSGWSFGGLIKTLTTTSESVIENYRRDLKEFGSGLKKEIEVAHGSLGTVSNTIDEIGSSVLKGTAQIISQGKDAILAVDLDSDSDNSNNNPNILNPNHYTTQQGLNSKPYSRLDAQVRAIQGEDSTYCEEPEDLDDYNKWKLGFDLGEKSEEIEGLIGENGAMESIYKRVVPNSVDNETFWCRYYYRVYKIKLAEDVRASIVKRAISGEEEDLTWDVDDDEEEEESNVVLKAEIAKSREVGSGDFGRIAKEESNVVSKEEIAKSGDFGRIVKEEESGVEAGKESANVDEVSNVVSKGGENRELGGKDDEKNIKEGDSVEELKGDKVDDEKKHLEGDSAVNKKELVLKSDEKVGSEGKADSGESGKDSDFSVVSTQPSMPEEEDLGWDEIEDLSSIDEKKVSHGGSPNRADMRKRLNAADEEEEDLSWDIEDDDEPTKA